MKMTKYSLSRTCEQDVFGEPTILPLGDKRKWSDFLERERHRPHHLRYTRQHLLEHLDPSQLFAQESNLQDEVNIFLTRNLVTFIHLAHIDERSKGFPNGFDEFKAILREAREKQFVSYSDWEPGINRVISWEPWHLHRSTLPFTPMSSPFHKLYGHLSDPIRIFTISGKFSGHTIPLSEDLLNAQMVMEAKLPNLPKKADSQYSRVVGIDYDAQFNDPDVRNGIVTCAALSLDGHHIALGFGSGAIELADIDHQRTISRFQLNPPNHPVWIEFVHGSHRVASEDNRGNVTILSYGMTPVNLGTLPDGSLPAATRVSDNGLFIIRVPWNTDNLWYDNMTLISILDNPHMQLLASPPSHSNYPPHRRTPAVPHRRTLAVPHRRTLATPHRRTLGFSPGARYIGAFDGLSAFTWSTDSGELIARYRVMDFKFWIVNPAVPPACSHRIPDSVSARPTLPLTTGIHDSKIDAGHGLDESWIKCPFYVLKDEGDEDEFEVPSSAAGKTPLFRARGYVRLPVFFNGRLELVAPQEYQPVGFFDVNDTKRLGTWYGDQVPQDPTYLYSPRSSKDGTRILLQGQQTSPIVVDLSQVI
ncbi:uncharacterized protein EI90DRAFT_173466 [Cantharellus anzutake]|uniref:uncharacterized protein n=1 Tax=Cantharellus anzutake TaxID=1750568 RepID=UPI001907A3EF|nr:uncharacterized protein EI90DRAFT_173466 [Cantharellus anzutake]KAF8336419.1 hypothetical protein EI90DRAFT_173466 [Cantharellus anzutake]